MKKSLSMGALAALIIFGAAARAEGPQTAIFPSLRFETEPASSPGAYITNIAAGYSISGYPF